MEANSLLRVSISDPVIVKSNEPWELLTGIVRLYAPTIALSNGGWDFPLVTKGDAI